MEVKPGYKQTEAGVIPEAWDCVKLGNLIALQRGHDLTWRDRRQGEVPVMGSAGQNGFHDTAIAKGPGVTLGRSGASFGQAHYCEQDFWPHNTALYVTDFRGNQPLFVFYFLTFIDFSRHNSGGAQQSLNRNFISPIAVGVPHPPEQRAIAEALSDMDALLEGLDRLIAKKRDLKQAAMQQLLTGQTSLPGFNGEWLSRKLGEILIEQAKTRRQAGSGKESGIYPFFTNDTQGGREFQDEYDFDEDAIIANTGGTAFFRHYSGRFAASMHCLVLKSTVDTKWIQYWLKMQEPIINDRCFQGSGLKHLNTKTLRDLDVLLPPLEEEQEAIADILTDIDAELRALEARREKTGALKQGMMQELLTGRIRLLPTEAHYA